MARLVKWYLICGLCGIIAGFALIDACLAASDPKLWAVACDMVIFILCALGFIRYSERLYMLHVLREAKK